MSQSEGKIIALCSQDLEKYDIVIYDILQQTDSASLFNKLTYFTYLKQNFGFKNDNTEKDFLVDLLKNQEISAIPKSFKTLKYKEDKLKIKAPVILSVKPNAGKETIELPENENPNLYLLLFKQLGNFKQLWYIYIFAALFSATTTQAK